MALAMTSQCHHAHGFTFTNKISSFFRWLKFIIIKRYIYHKYTTTSSIDITGKRWAKTQNVGIALSWSFSRYIHLPVPFPVEKLHGILNSGNLENFEHVKSQ